MPLIERVLDRTPCDTLDEHRRRGGGVALDAARQTSRDTVIAEIEASGLRGRGGAGFPTGLKWRTVAAATTPGSTPVVVNAAEGEPATFKDRQLIRMNPFKIIEGALVAAFAVDTDRVIIAIKGTFGPEHTRLRDAVAAVDQAGWTKEVEIRIVEGPSEYLFGEETGLLEVLDGRQPFPRITPPYLRGVQGERVGDDDGAPALVDNVETLANVPAIIAQGADWFRRAGTPESPGTIVCTITGHCRRHGVGEVPMGTPLREAITLIGGGPEEGRRIVAAMSGVANPLLTESQLDTPLTYEAMAQVGSGLGAGGFFVCDDATDIAAVVYGASRFLAVESCGQCEPCKRDGIAIALALRALCTGEATEDDLAALPDRVSTVADGARCYLATQQQRVVGGALQTFPDAFRLRPNPAIELTPEPILPITDIVDGRAVLETSHLDKQPDWTYDDIDSGKWPAAALGDSPVEVDAPASRQVPDDAADVIATGDAGPPDPLQPLLDMHAGIRQALDRLAVAADKDRGGVADELRGRLALHADVTRRVVHPMASRVAAAPADDAGWRAERDETVADRMLARLEQLGADGDAASSVQAIAAELRSVLDRDETQIVGLLRTHMDEQDLRKLGAAIHEACAASNLAIGRGPMTSAADETRR